MAKRHSTTKLIALMLLAALATFILTFVGLRSFHGINSPLNEDVQRFREIREVIARRYVGIHDDEALTEAALRATVRALGDRWSFYLTAEEYAEHLRRMGNRQHGIGITFQRDGVTNDIVIERVQRGSPAEEAGLLAGETIVTIAWIPTRSLLTTEEVRQLVTDHFGGLVRLEIRDENGDLRITYVEVKDFYVNPIAFEMLDGNVGYIDIANFDLTAGAETILAIEALLEDGAESLIFDVRYNGGGRVDELLRILDFLLPPGELFVFEDSRGHESVRYAGPGYLDMPIVVLINEQSFSAAEFFAAILQEYEWAEIVGTPTSGKGRSQQMISLRSGSAINLSTSRYLTPGRVDLYEAGGIQPDVLVVNETGGVDAQLAAAVKLLG